MPKKPKEIIYHNGYKGKIHFRSMVTDDGGRIISGYTEDGYIYVNCDREDYWQARTLLHEILHNAMKCPAHVDTNADIEEVIVLTIENNLYEIWRLNPEVFEWIHEMITSRRDV
jgi:hypothetical protein